MRVRSDGFFLALAALAGCSSIPDPTSGHDGGSDTGITTDSGMHAEGGTDAGSLFDAATDGRTPGDTGVEADVSTDATRPTDANQDAGRDATPPTDASHDAGVVTGCAVAPVILGAATSSVASWSRITGTLNVDYYGDGYHDVDVTHFETIWSNPTFMLVPWPGQYGVLANIPLPIRNYISAEFTVPSPYFNSPNAPALLYGRYAVGESDFSAPISMTISTHCGDFGQLSPTTIVPGCIADRATPSSGLFWRASTSCVLQDGTTYYLNIINADISALPTTGTATSDQNSRCQFNACSDPIENGPGSWSGYQP